MSITIRLACGHAALTVSEEIDIAPVCPECGERRVRHVTARAPRFRGVCQGPSARSEMLAAMPVAVAAQGPLTLKDPMNG